jgi:putative flippase GtrA
VTLKARFVELCRYYGVGVINTAFGYGLFAALVWLKLNPFVAQIIAHLCGMVFNFTLYRLHVFPGHQPRIGPYIATYAVNYALSVAALKALLMAIASPYVAGFASIVVVSAINYLLLKTFVFNRPNVPAR